MTGARAPGAAQERGRRIFQHLLGGHGGAATLGVVALLAGLGWFGDSLFEWITDVGRWLDGGIVEDWLPTHRLIAVGLFALQLGVLWWLASGAQRAYRPRVGSDRSPAPVRGLILYLSHLAIAEKLAELEAGADGIAGIEDFRQRYGTLNWRMPLEAIAYHLARLEEVIVITSEGKGGSTKQWRTFKRVVAACFPTARARLRFIGELDSRYQPGLDFEDVGTVSKATDASYWALRDAGIGNADILIDITGGQKPNAVAGTAIALAEGRRIQYVACDHDTHRCHLSVYDVTYDS